MAKMFLKKRILICSFLFLFVICPVVLWLLDRTLVFEDRLIRAQFALAPYDRILGDLALIREMIYFVYGNDEQYFRSAIEKNRNNIDLFLKKISSDFADLHWQLPPAIFNPSVISFYVTGKEGETWWLGYNLEPPPLKGRFGLDRVSQLMKEKISRGMKQLKPGRYDFLYGSFSIDAPPLVLN